MARLSEVWLFLWQNGEVHNYQFRLITIDRVFTFAADDRSTSDYTSFAFLP